MNRKKVPRFQGVEGSRVKDEKLSAVSDQQENEVRIERNRAQGKRDLAVGSFQKGF